MRLYIRLSKNLNERNHCKMRRYQFVEYIEQKTKNRSNGKVLVGLWQCNDFSLFTWKYTPYWVIKSSNFCTICHNYLYNNYDNKSVSKSKHKSFDKAIQVPLLGSFSVGRLHDMLPLTFTIPLNCLASTGQSVYYRLVYSSLSLTLISGRGGLFYHQR